MTGICIALILGIPLVDLGIKYYIEKNISREEEIPLCKGKLLVRHLHNEGAMLNFMDHNPKAVRWFSAGMTAILAVYSLWFLGREGQKIEKVSLSFLLGGAISNVYDRIVRKYVVDYFGFKTKWKKCTDVTYNIGDLFIFAGALGIVLTSVFRKK